MRKLVWIAIGVVAVLAVAVVGAVMFVHSDAMRRTAASQASSSLGRPVSIGGLDVTLGWPIHVTVTDLTIANPQWARAQNLADIGRLDFDLRVWPLLVGSFDVPVAAIDNADFHLERTADGRQSWELAGLSSDGAAAEPAFRRLEASNTRVHYRDAAQDIRLDGTVETGETDGGPTLTVDLEGKLAGDALAIRLVGGAILALRSDERPYPVTIEVTHGKSRFRGEGTIGDPLTLAGVNADMRLAGPDLSKLLPSLSLPLPATPPYDISAHVVREGARWTLTGIDGKLGDTDIAGEVAVDTAPEKPVVTGGLISKRLDFDDLAPLIGRAPDIAEKASPEQKKMAAAQKQKLFPTTTLDPEAFRAATIELDFKAHKVSAPAGVPLTSIDMHVALKDGRLALKPFEAGTAGGPIRGAIVIDAREDVPSVATDLRFRRLDLRRLFPGTQWISDMGGVFHGAIDITGTGLSLDKVMANARGRATLLVEKGSISGLVVEAIGVDVTEALTMVVSGDSPIALNCGRVDLSADSGLATVERALVDTSDSVLVAGGTINLAEERMNLRIEARAKDFSLIDASAPVTVTGPILDPSIGIGGIDPLPFFELGDQKDLDCTSLLSGSGEVRESEGGPAARP